MERESNAMFHEWRPKHGVMFMMVMITILVVMIAVLILSSIHASAQSGAVLKNEPAFDVKGMLTMLLPAIWASVGPLVIAAITKGVNSLGAFIPRPVQVILASILGAVGGALAGDGGIAAAAAVSGGASQVYAATRPEALRTTSPPQPKPEV